jgi:hypothetical protein
VSAKTDLRDLIGKKPQLFAHRSKELNIAAPILPERESFTQVNLLSVKTVVDDLTKKIIGRLRGEIMIESDDYRLLDAEDLEIREPLVKRLQQRRRGRGMQDRTRMRVKGDRSGDRSHGPGTLHDPAHYLLMA